MPKLFNSKRLTKRNVMNTINTLRSLLILIVLMIVATILSSNFLTPANLFNVVKQITVGALVACGMTYVIMTGGIDLSVGSIIGLAGALAVSVLAKTDSPLLAILVALGVGLACGVINGFFVAQCRIPAFIATLGTMTLLRGCTLLYTGGSPIPVKNEAYKFIGKGSVFGVPVLVIILLVVFIIGHYVMSKTTLGRSVYALGGNREAARLAGIPVKRVEWIVYTISGLTSGIAAIGLTSRLATAQSTSGEGIEMDAIAAVILGGTSMSGGKGFVLPTIFGAIIMGIIDNLLTLMMVPAQANKIVKGAVILAAVLIDKKVSDLSAKAD